MTYFQGFLVPAKTAEKQAYRDFAAKTAPTFADYGALRTVECWGDTVPDGKRTDMKRAVQAEGDETIVFSWVEWPDRATCDAAAEKMMADERLQLGDTPMPFDMKRMIYAGFDVVADAGAGGRFGYVDGIVGPAPDDGRQAFTDYAAKLARFFLDRGALRLVDGWGADVPDGKVTDFRRAVAAEPGEQVIFGWLEWPDKATREAAFAAMGDSPEVSELPPTMDMQRAIFGGFVPILDTDHE
jgi:uncharacterized protein YbaA (DUF1428 family)